MTATQRRLEKWEQYLTPEVTPTYGTYADRVQEYRVVGQALARLGLADDDLIVDVGAGSCDMDHWLRTGLGWRGRYWPVDGAVQGVDLNVWWPPAPADWFVSVETLEHVEDPLRLVAHMQRLARKGVVVTTPNADTHDVRATDPTHVRPITPAELKEWGFDVTLHDFTPSRGPGDTMMGTYSATANT